MRKPLYFLNGPNLNLLGNRDRLHYGRATLSEIESAARALALSLGVDLVARQSNHEGMLIDWVHEASHAGSGLVINPGALGHTSLALRDAVAAASLPAIEVHLSNVYGREDYRHHSHLSGVVRGVIAGLGAEGYLLAVQSLAQPARASSRKAAGKRAGKTVRKTARKKTSGRAAR